jgi:hypothetical protein
MKVEILLESNTYSLSVVPYLPSHVLVCQFLDYLVGSPHPLKIADTIDKTRV